MLSDLIIELVQARLNAGNQLAGISAAYACLSTDSAILSSLDLFTQPTAIANRVEEIRPTAVIPTAKLIDRAV